MVFASVIWATIALVWLYVGFKMWAMWKGWHLFKFLRNRVSETLYQVNVMSSDMDSHFEALTNSLEKPKGSATQPKTSTVRKNRTTRKY